jgi:hypothetical protein
MFWPPELSEKEAELSVIPMLLETQDQFITIISVDVPGLDELFQVVNSASLAANVFVKHLVVLADFGGENLMRVNSMFDQLFPTRRLDYVWNGQLYSYDFKVLPLGATLNNDRLAISGRKLLEEQPLDELLQDVTALLVFGSASIDEEVANVLAKCEIGNYLGQPRDLQEFIKQRYIWVSRITGGAQANRLGQLAQDFVCEYLRNNLRIEGVDITRNGHLPGVTDRDPQENITRPSRFDVVVANGNKYAGVEVSFQVTTNSTIERKASLARSRFEQVEGKGYKVAYVIDGAGNLIQRESATGTLCSYSDCTVAFSRPELDVLCEFLRDYFATAGS